ncbi:MAG TPA: luciferase family protein [Candidatus Caenarcaniphilales bacterium]
MKTAHKVDDLAQTIEHELLRWPGVTAGPHRFGGIEFRVNNREIGHLHGDYQADIPFSARLRKQLVAQGRAEPHHLYPNSGWVSYYIHSIEDIPALIELLRLNCDRLTAASEARRSEPSEISASA